MKRHLMVRLMVIMMALVLLIVSVIGVLLFTNIAIDYNRKFYDEMDQMIARIEFLRLHEGKIENYISYIPNQEEINPLTTDRNYYILRDGTVVAGNSFGGVIKRTENLKRVLKGEENKNAFLFFEDLDFAYNMKVDGYTLYVVDHRTELFSTMRDYLGLFLQALLAGAVLTIVLSYFFSKSFLIPLHRLTQSAKQMEQEGTFDQIPSNGRDEIGELTRVFNAMGYRITRNINTLQALLENIPKPLFAINEQGTIVHTNEAYKRIFDAPPQKDLFFEGHGEDRRFLIQMEGRFYHVYRSPFPLEKGKEGTLFMLDDITEAEKLENERRQFVANVSHELKTPLTVIKSYSETLQEGVPNEATQMRFLSVIEKNADQMNATVSQLLELSKTEAEENAPREPLDLAEAIREVAEAMHLEFAKKELQLLTHLPERRILHCPPDQIRRVIINLLSNSVKYSNPGGKVEVALSEREGGVAFSVKDEGIGIEKKHIPHLFDKFYRVDKARSRETGGTGLGLSIVKSVVEQMGGEVTVESVFGEGSCFTCYFPDETN